MNQTRQNPADLFRLVARSHSYWGRKPIMPLLEIFRDMRHDNVLLDPFCGSGSALIAALYRKGRVIASDLNPMAVFLSGTIIRPLNLAALEREYRNILLSVRDRILEYYAIECPACHGLATINYTIWEGSGPERHPTNASISCDRCERTRFIQLSQKERERQIMLSELKPSHWFPRTKIHAKRRPLVDHHYQLFTGRNLAALACLSHAIESVPNRCTNAAFRYIFSALLYSCSEMQQYLDNHSSSSMGWFACRFYVPNKRKESNVWRAFEGRFRTFCEAKRVLNMHIPWVRATDSIEAFFSEKYEALVFESDAFRVAPELVNKADYIFLDPPYNPDIDYFGFSEFWGCWQRMRFDFAAELRTDQLRDGQLENLLGFCHSFAKPTAKLTLALSPKRIAKWDVRQTLSDSGYSIDWKRSGPFLYNNSLKRGGMDSRQDYYFSLDPWSSEIQPGPEKGWQDILDRHTRNKDYSRAAPYIRVAAHTLSETKSTSLDPSPEFIRQGASKFAPTSLHYYLQNMTQKQILSEAQDANLNRRTFHTLCYVLLDMILSHDRWKLSPRAEDSIEQLVFGKNPVKCKKWGVPPAADFFTFSAALGRRRILFFFDGEKKARLPRAFRSISKSDGNRFATLAVLIVRDSRSMQQWRSVHKAEQSPRVFFTTFDEIRETAEVLCPKMYREILAPSGDRLLLAEHYEKAKTIMSFHAKVLANTQVGGKDSTLYKLAFLAPQLRDARPSQFVMMDPLPLHPRRSASDASKDKGVKRSNIMKPQPYLKRPFGIHRVFFKGFEPDYLKNLRLPQSLAVALHTVFPERFDILYKVLMPDGIGTKLMRELTRGDLVHMVGPLGSPFNVRSLRAAGIEEVHIIGGGVGMAPLVFFVQALRYFSFDVKAFIGIADIGSIQYKDDLERTFQAEPRNAFAFIDDLLSTGLNAEDVFVSCDKQLPRKLRSIPTTNMNLGLISDQYASFLMNRGNRRARTSKKNIMAFACGPLGMLRAVEKITSDNEINLKVLLERRMACGIGVCLSCVCRVRGQQGPEVYSRVCTEGPLFKAGDIAWETDD